MAQGSSQEDPYTKLRNALVDALVQVRFAEALPDRRLLVNLVRRDVAGFPDVAESPQVRSHVVQIVMACLTHPGGLRALLAALWTMAPDTPASRHVRELVESAPLRSRLPKGEVLRIHDLLARAEGAVPEPGWWRPAVRELAPGGEASGSLSQVFDQLAGQSHGRGRLPPALVLVDTVAAGLDGPTAAELSSWVWRQAELLEVLAQMDTLRRSRQPVHRSSDVPAGRSDVPADQAVVEPPDGATDEPVGARGEPADIESRADDGKVVDGEAWATDADPGVMGTDPDAGGEEAGTGEPGGRAWPRRPPRPARSAIRDRSYWDDYEDLPDLPTHRLDAPAMSTGGAPSVGPNDKVTDVAPVAAVRLPKVWGDVPQRNPNFTGREDLLDHLHHQLQTVRQTAVLPQALHGMGGIGKTQLAIEYVHQHSGDYDLIWWVPAEQDGQILASLTELAQRLDLDVGPEANRAVPAVRAALSTGQVPYASWLLVFDNAESPTDVSRYFPTGGAGKILVTSRNPEWAWLGQAIEVDVFSRDESRTFLRMRNPDLSDADTDRLAEALGDLPLAVEQAAAWRAATGMPVDEYLELLRDKHMELLDDSSSLDDRRSVAAAWKLSLEKLREVNDGAFQLLQVCSFFAPAPISRDLLVGRPTAPVTPVLDAILGDAILLSRSIRDIQRYALARIDHRRNTLQIHRLIQAVLIGAMDDEERALFWRGAHTLLAAGNPNAPARRERWDTYHALRPHVVESRAVESTDPRVQDLVLGMVQFLHHWGDHVGSERLAQEAHELWVRRQGEADPRALRLAKWLGWTRWTNGRYAEARELNRRTLELYRSTLGDENEGTIDATSMVALDLRTSGQFFAARDLDERTFEVACREFGADDPVTLACAHRLGLGLRLTGEFGRAAELDRDTLVRQAVVLGSDDETTLNTQHCLLIDLRESGAYLEAHRQHEELYARHLAVFGPNAPATLRTGRSLAVARRKAGDHAGASILGREIYEKYRRRYDGDHPETVAAAVNVAIDLRYAGDLQAALAMCAETLERYDRMFGPQHAYTLAVRSNLAVVHRARGDAELALEHDREVCAGLRESLGEEHPVSLACATNLASDLYALHSFQAAYECDVETLVRLDHVLGVNHPVSLGCSANVAMDLRALRRVREADELLADTMTRLRQVLGDRHPATIDVIRQVRIDCDVDPLPL
ncbi:FxSxx-COOH system tetratricopeptide repeat protein [Plantactinospora sp. WMMB782]|uniref:FxSxx-COOH system tetratricopeptide repeat protein n=1 Tax=Plantactinospora sp. WMMB782 TaxID=3404121 RepID=UPI003B95B609